VRVCIANQKSYEVADSYGYKIRYSECKRYLIIEKLLKSMQ